MNKLTFLQKIKSFISNHKIWSLLIIIVIIVGSYFIFKSKANTETRYTTSSVSKGNIVISVSGSGQVEPSDTININANASGTVDYVGVKVGQTVKKGTLIASVDSRNAKIALETAQLSLDILKQPNTLTVLQNENSIKSAYDSSWNNVSSFVLDMQTVTSGLGDLYNSSGYLGYKNQILLNQIGKDKIDLSYKAYWDAKNSLDATTKLYKSLSRTSSTSEIDNLISNSLDTSREISNAVKLSQSSLDNTSNFSNDTT